MSEKKTDAATGEPKSHLDLLEEALVGTHQLAPGETAEEDVEPDGSPEIKPDVPGHRSP